MAVEQTSRYVDECCVWIVNIVTRALSLTYTLMCLKIRQG
jgi:hypothetical protein